MIKHIYMRKIMLTALTALALPATAMAQSFDNLAEIEVLPGWRNSNGDHMAALRITLADGWKTYWRAPGDGGIPPRFSFNGSEAISSIRPHWPTPEVFSQNGLQSIGYRDSLVLPLTVGTTAPESPIDIAGQISIGVCEEICIPITLDFDGSLLPDGARDTSIVASLIDQPLPQSEANVGAVTCAVAPNADGLQVTATIDLPPTGQTEVVVLETGDPYIWVSESDVSRTGDQLSAVVDMVNTTGRSFALDRSEVRITVLGSDQAVDIQGCSVG